MHKKLTINCEKKNFSQFILLNFISEIMPVLIEYFQLPKLFLIINIVSYKTMKNINFQYYPFKSISSILAFPMLEFSEVHDFVFPLGEIYFCYPLILKKLTREPKKNIKIVIELFLHSFLHLLGHQHFDQSGRDFMENTSLELQQLIYQKIFKTSYEQK